MTRYYGTIGSGSSGFVANGPATITGDSITTSSTVVTINDQQIDMTDAPVGTQREVDGFVLLRTEHGIEAKDPRSKPKRRSGRRTTITRRPEPQRETPWYTVEARSHTAPATGNLGIEIGSLPVKAVEFEVTVDDAEVPKQSSLDEQIDAQRLEAAMLTGGNIAAGTDWPAGTYLLIVRGRDSATAYVADIDEHRAYTVRKRD